MCRLSRRFFWSGSMRSAGSFLRLALDRLRVALSVEVLYSDGAPSGLRAARMAEAPVKRLGREVFLCVL